jgi:ABC-type polysaccharide/polyol phosphate export permease
MEIIKHINFSISQCDITDIINETNRFLIHIVLIHIFTHILDKNKPLFGLELIKTLVITAISIITYNILFKKLIDAKLNIAKSKCFIYNTEFEATNKLI